MTRRITTKNMRVPIEFFDLIDDLDRRAQKETGLAPNKAATMRRLTRKLNGKLVVRGLDFDFRIF